MWLLGTNKNLPSSIIWVAQSADTKWALFTVIMVDGWHNN
jgi:hypothetical protein